MILATFLRKRRYRGMSLVEVLIASLILFFIFLSILPLFARAKMSNRRGNDSSLMSSFLTSGMEVVQQSSVNHNTFNDQYSSQEDLEDIREANQNAAGEDPFEDKAISLRNSFYFSDTENYTGLPTLYWGTGTPDPTGTDAELGDEEWLNREDAEAHEGRILWLKDTYLFNWNLSDIGRGTVSTGSDENEVVTVGHPQLFDVPMEWNPDNPPDVREVRVMVRSAVSTSPLGVGPAMVLGYYRTF